MKDFSKAQELFEREAKILHQLDHPQIPKFLETIVEDLQGKTRFFVVQQYISGDNYDKLRNCSYPKGMPEAEVKVFLQNLLPVLDYLHSQHPPILHRDISPDNIIRCNTTGLPKLIDFGAVKQVFHTFSNRPGTVIGKEGYAPPEQRLGTKNLTPSCDLYALGATAIDLLRGKTEQSWLSADGEWQWQDQVQSGVSPEFVAILQKLVAPIVNDRFQSAQAVIAALGIEAPAQEVPIENPQPLPRPVPPESVTPVTPRLIPQNSPTPRPPTDPIVEVFKGFLSPEFRHFAKQQAIVVSIGFVVLVGPFLVMDAWKDWQIDRQRRIQEKTEKVKPADPSKNASETLTECDRFNRSDTLEQLSDEDYNYLMQDIDTIFWEKYPELEGTTLSLEDSRRAEWCAMGNQLLSEL